MSRECIGVPIRERRLIKEGIIRELEKYDKTYGNTPYILEKIQKLVDYGFRLEKESNERVQKLCDYNNSKLGKL